MTVEKNPSSNDGTQFETWLDEQSDETKTLISNHIGGLRSALEQERTQRKSLDKSLRDATKQLEEGSAARADFEKISAELTATQTRATFLEQAAGAGVTNLKLAWLAASSGDAIGDDGTADFDKLKAGYPELFHVDQPAPTPRGNAGTGTGSQPTPTPQSMDTLIRQGLGSN